MATRRICAIAYDYYPWETLFLRTAESATMTSYAAVRRLARSYCWTSVAFAVRIASLSYHIFG